MNQLLEQGQAVQLARSPQLCRVEQYLGSGSQGEVYQVTLDGTSLALKWYYPAAATEAQWATLEALVRMPPPSPRFLWPVGTVSGSGLAGFGYLMALRPDEYKGLPALMRRTVDVSFRELITAGFQLADSYLKLHSRGLAYRDISFGNVFLNPSNGDALICDNDNAAVNGISAGVSGTPRFMAPEIVIGHAHPSAQTDLFSLAVLLFYMLMFHHPLDGRLEHQIRCLDAASMRRLYGTDALFIFHPTDQRNAPVQGYQDNALSFWKVYPQFVRDLFTQAFVAGLHEPGQRVVESMWRKELLRLRDAIRVCPHCGMQNFYDASAGDPAARPCFNPACRKPLGALLRLIIDGSSMVILDNGVELYPHHVESGREYDLSAPLALVNRHPANPSLLGLKNLSIGKWVYSTPDGANKDVEPGRSAPLLPGSSILFGSRRGAIHA